MSGYERIVTIKPAYDCLMIQPCVHGSKDCGTKPGASHGRHNAELWMTLRNQIAEVCLVVGTGWDLPQTPMAARIQEAPRSAFVEMHSSIPFYEEQSPQGGQCDLWETCYGDVGYTMADQPTRLLVTEGSDAVWAWLKELHREKFLHALGGAA